MINLLKRISICLSCVAAVGLSSGVSAKSQCSGLSSSACSSKSSQCTWRKSSVDKNGKKTKAHCRALPGKSKVTSKAKSKTSTAKKSKSTTKKATTKKATTKKATTKKATTKKTTAKKKTKK